MYTLMWVTPARTADCEETGQLRVRAGAGGSQIPHIVPRQHFSVRARPPWLLCRPNPPLRRAATSIIDRHRLDHKREGLKRPRP